MRHLRRDLRVLVTANEAGAMNSISNSPSLSKILATVLRANNEVRPVMLLGTDASFRSGAPLAAEAVRRIAKQE